MEGVTPWAGSVLLPRAVFDAGGEEWDVLGGTITRELESIRVGEVLQITAQARRTREHIVSWSFDSGHDLVRMVTERGHSCFWIRKGGET